MSPHKHYLTIGDLHGRDCWSPAAQEWILLSEDHIVVFLADYVDSRTLPLAAQVANLNNILYLKRGFPLQVVLLLGNHDAHYLWNDAPRGSGFNVASHAALFPLFNDNAHLFQVAYQHDTPDGQHYLWTHAGVSDAWLASVPPFAYESESDAPPVLADALNFMADTGRMRPHLLAVGGPRGGRGPGGPLWADASELTIPVPGYHQIVGHTALEEGRPLVDVGNATTSAVLCDYNAHAPAEGFTPASFFYQLTLSCQ